MKVVNELILLSLLTLLFSCGVIEELTGDDGDAIPVCLKYLELKDLQEKTAIKNEGAIRSITNKGINQNLPTGDTLLFVSKELDRENIILKERYKTTELAVDAPLEVGKTYEIIEVRDSNFPGTKEEPYDGYFPRGDIYRKLKAYKFVSILAETDGCEENACFDGPGNAFIRSWESRTVRHLTLIPKIQYKKVTACGSAPPETDMLTIQMPGKYLLFHDGEYSVGKPNTVNIKVIKLDINYLGKDKGKHRALNE